MNSVTESTRVYPRFGLKPFSGKKKKNSSTQVLSQFLKHL